MTSATIRSKGNSWLRSGSAARGVFATACVSLAILAVRLYRAALGSVLGPSCRFEPSCSHYAEAALMRYGLTRGTWLTLWRILRCHPWNEGGWDPVPEN